MVQTSQRYVTWLMFSSEHPPCGVCWMQYDTLIQFLTWKFVTDLNLHDEMHYNDRNIWNSNFEYTWIPFIRNDWGPGGGVPYIDFCYMEFRLPCRRPLGFRNFVPYFEYELITSFPVSNIECTVLRDPTVNAIPALYIAYRPVSFRFFSFSHIER